MNKFKYSLNDKNCILYDPLLKNYLIILDKIYKTAIDTIITIIDIN